MLFHRAAFALLSVPLVASAQPCSPAWSTAVGAPGITSDGYAGPMIAYQSGGIEALFVGGSFQSAGGFVTKGIAKFNLENDKWSAVGGGVSSQFTNSFVTSLAVHDRGFGSELFVGGSFERAGVTAGTANLAGWNGTRWLGLGAIVGPVWALASWKGDLYVAGSMTSVGGVATSGIAKYSAATGWQTLGAGLGGGFSPTIFSLAVFNDGSGEKLYAAGRCDSIGGVNGLIARWTGTAWEPVGAGLIAAETFSDVECMTVHNDGTGPALYVGGWTFRAVGKSGSTSVAKWNGTTWTHLGATLGGRTTSLASFDDGSGPGLYAGGTAQPAINYLARWTGAAWQTVNGGVGQPSGPPWPSVFGLYSWRNRLWVAGDFDYANAGQSPASGMVALTSCLGACPSDINKDGFSDAIDYDLFVAAFYSSSITADYNGDGFLDAIDLDSFLRDWVLGC